jgi:Lon protease-like protein
MPLIDLTQLDTEQTWAIQWGRQQANDGIQYQIDYATAENARITAENEKLLPEHRRQLLPIPELETDQSWADKQVWSWVNQQLYAFRGRVKQNVESKIESMSLEERLQLMQTLQVAPVLRQE